MGGSGRIDLKVFGALVCAVSVAGCSPWRAGAPARGPSQPDLPTPTAATSQPATAPPVAPDPAKPLPPRSATAPAPAPVPAPAPAVAPTKPKPAASAKSAAAQKSKSNAPAPPPAAAPSAPTSPAAASAAAAAPAAASKPAAPALDLAGLEQRLKDTRAIGVFTKLSLKNQVDDLLDEFRAFHQPPAKALPRSLRQEYDSLMQKVLGLLQEGDPQLASAISSSREAIWGVLTDPEKFAKI